MVKCNRCGTIYPQEMKSCPHCGAEEPVYDQQGAIRYGQVPSQLPPYNGMAIAGFVLSCVSMVLCCFPVTALVGLILSIAGMQQITRTGMRGRGLAIAGLILNGLSLAAWVLLMILAFCGVYIEGLYY